MKLSESVVLLIVATASLVLACAGSRTEVPAPTSGPAATVPVENEHTTNEPASSEPAAEFALDPRDDGFGYQVPDLPAESAVPHNSGKVATGKVKWFNDAKGYGFITPDDGTGDVFVHHAVIVKEGYGTLQEGQRVQYIVLEGPKGRQAQRVQVIQNPGPE